MSTYLLVNALRLRNDENNNNWKHLLTQLLTCIDLVSTRMDVPHVQDGWRTVLTHTRTGLLRGNLMNSITKIWIFTNGYDDSSNIYNFISWGVVKVIVTGEFTGYLRLPSRQNEFPDASYPAKYPDCQPIWRRVDVQYGDTDAQGGHREAGVGQ